MLRLANNKDMRDWIGAWPSMVIVYVLLSGIVDCFYYLLHLILYIIKFMIAWRG